MTSKHLFEPLLARHAREHQLVNRTRGELLATVVEAAFDSQSRRKGLLGRRSLPLNTVVAIAPSNAIHTFGMHFPIDVVFITREGTVVKRVLALKRGRVAIALRAFAVLEFAAGHPGVATTAVGDLLGLEPVDTDVRGLER